MVDKLRQISSNPHDHLRVEETQDATEERKRRQSYEDEEEGQHDEFQKGTQKKSGGATQRRLVLDDLQSLELVASDVDSLFLIEVQLKSDSSLLVVDIQLKTGQGFSNAVISVPRVVGVKLRNLIHKAIRVDQITDQSSLSVYIHEKSQDEKTLITRSDEKTLSKTIKMALQENKLVYRLGMRDSKTNEWNREIVIAYLTAFVVLVFFIFIYFFVGI